MDETAFFLLDVTLRLASDLMLSVSYIYAFRKLAWTEGIDISQARYDFKARFLQWTWSPAKVEIYGHDRVRLRL